jgi:hypothetical protein
VGAWGYGVRECDDGFEGAMVAAELRAKRMSAREILSAPNGCTFDAGAFTDKELLGAAEWLVENHVPIEQSEIELIKSAVDRERTEIHTYRNPQARTGALDYFLLCVQGAMAPVPPEGLFEVLLKKK